MADDLVSNRKAKFQYHLLESWEAGVALLGSEVKSLRDGQGQLQDAYVDHVRGNFGFANVILPLGQAPHGQTTIHSGIVNSY